MVVLAASAQVIRKDEPAKPPSPPKPPIEKMGDVPPPPPPPPPPLAPPPPEPPVPGVPLEDVDISDDYETFLKRNPSVKNLGWNHQNVLTVHLKSGKQEKYNLSDEKSRKAAEDKYGELPAAPPPPPPPPPPPMPPAKNGELTVS